MKKRGCKQNTGCFAKRPAVVLAGTVTHATLDVLVIIPGLVSGP
jgi:hypothetical protein